MIEAVLQAVSTCLLDTNAINGKNAICKQFWRKKEKLWHELNRSRLSRSLLRNSVQDLKSLDGFCYQSVIKQKNIDKRLSDL